MTKFIKFPSIEKFSDVNAMVKRAFPIEERPTITYRGKVKLHGTNAAIMVAPNGDVTGGKRSGICTVDVDNAGFAAWLETVKKRLTPHPTETYIIYGEWAGPGIQKSVAVSEIEKKAFFPFSVYFTETNNWVFEPENIKLYVDGLPDTYVLPWSTDSLVVDMRLQSSMEDFTSTIAPLVEACDKSDPFIKEVFGIDGIGEGYVFYPTDTWLTYGEAKKYRADYLFKAKGESHSNSKVSKFKAIVPVDPVIAATINDFVSQFVTEARCMQGVNEACGGEVVSANIGKFMAWIGADVKKESVNELEASGLDWKTAGKAVNQAGRDWFIRRIDQQIVEAA